MILLDGKNLVSKFHGDREIVRVYHGENLVWERPDNVQYLYREGDECIGNTGGWDNVSFALTNWSWASKTAFKKTSDSLYAEIAGGRSAYVGTNQKISFQGYNTLIVDYYTTDALNNPATGIRVSIVPKKSFSVSEEIAFAKCAYYDGDEMNANLHIDVSGFPNAYVAISALRDQRLRIKNVWLE